MLTDVTSEDVFPADIGDPKYLAEGHSLEIVMIVAAPAGAIDFAGGQILTISSKRRTQAQGRCRYVGNDGTSAGMLEGVASQR